MARFVTFPGTAGSIATTEDTNLMFDADTAHLQQSIGQWRNLGGSGAISVAATIPPIFGTNHGQIGTGSSFPFARAGFDAGSFGAAVTVGTAYVASIYVGGNEAGETSLECRYVDDGFATVGPATSFQDVHPVDSMSQFVVQMPVAPAGATRLAMQLIWFAPDGSSAPNRAGAEFYFDAANISEGTASTFIPSQYIVGDLDIRFDAAMPSWSPAGTEHIQTLRQGGTSDEILRFTGGTNMNFFWWDGALQNLSLDFPTVGDGVQATLKMTVVAATGLFRTFVDDVEYGSYVAQGALGRIYQGTPMTVGGRAGVNGEELAGDVYSFERRDGIDGPIVSVFDADDIII